MGGQCLYCDLCGGEFSSKQEWNEHLVDDQHQNVSRERWRNFLSDECSRTTSAVVYTNFWISRETGLDIIRKFSERVLDYVVDFVFWKGRRTYGILQFESRRKLEEILGGLEKGTEATLNGNLVYLRKASDIRPLEWRAHGYSCQAGAGISMVEPTKSVTPPSDVNILPSLIIPRPETSLQQDWNSICALIELGDSECSTALELVSALTTLYRSKNPTARVVFCRNYFLRLQSPTEANDAVLLFSYIPQTDSFPNITAIKVQLEWELIRSAEFARLLPGFKPTNSPYDYFESSQFLHDTTGFMCNTIRKPILVVDAYLVRLTQYLTLFDPRLQAVLTLVTFWAKVHQVRIAEEKTQSTDEHYLRPDPFPLQWMVILFLIKCKVLPSVRQVTERPHDLLLVCNKRGHGHDIGFSTDEGFVQEWREGKTVPEPFTNAFITSVASLATDFFKFYSTHLKAGCWLLNPKDGELIKREGSRVHKSSLSREEILQLTTVEEKERVPELVITNSRISILHPLVLTWRLSFSVERWMASTCLKMEGAAHRLEQFLRSQHNRNETSLQDAIVGGEESVDNFRSSNQVRHCTRPSTTCKTKRGDWRRDSLSQGDQGNDKRSRRE